MRQPLLDLEEPQRRPSPGSDGNYLVRLGDDLGRIASSIQKIKEYNKTLGTDEDTTAQRAKFSALREEAKAKCLEVKHGLESHPPQGAERARHTKIAAQFNSIMKEFEAVVKESIQKEKESIARRMSMRRGPPDLSNPDGGSGGEGGGGMMADQHQKYAPQTQTDYFVQQDMNTELKSLEGELVELHACFVDMKTLVSAQGKDIDLIENNVAETLSRTEAGVGQLEQANTYQKKSRKKMCCIIVFFTVATIAVIVFLSVSGKL